jgi:uncharacterized membrane protein required for colicin V production
MVIVTRGSYLYQGVLLRHPLFIVTLTVFRFKSVKDVKESQTTPMLLLTVDGNFEICRARCENVYIMVVPDD